MSEPVPERDQQQIDVIAELLSAGGVSVERCKQALTLIYELGICEGAMRTLNDALHKILK